MCFEFPTFRKWLLTTFWGENSQYFLTIFLFHFLYFLILESMLNYVISSLRSLKLCSFFFLRDSILKISIDLLLIHCSFLLLYPICFYYHSLPMKFLFQDFKILSSRVSIWFSAIFLSFQVIFNILLSILIIFL